MAALLTSWNLEFKITNNIATDYDSGMQQGILGDFTQATQEDIVVATGVVNKLLPSSIENLCVMYILCDQAVQISLVPQGSTLGQVQPITLYPRVPTMLAVQYVKEVYVTNQTGQQANLTFISAGK
jgi:hypothetical protein